MNPIKGGVITTPFEEMRPLSVSLKKRNHIHGALDIAPVKDTSIYAPISGYVFGYMAVRFPHPFKQMWPEMPIIHDDQFSFRNYFYDMYGGVLVLQEIDDYENIINTHLLCHCWGNQIFNRIPLSSVDIHYVEEKAKKRFPIHAFYTDRYKFNRGDKIGSVGDAGYSTGKHLHWEIHPGKSWVTYADRINPLKYM